MRVHKLGGAKQLRRTCNPFWKHDPNFLVRNQRAFLIFLLFRQSFSDFLWCFNAFARWGLYFSCSLQGAPGRPPEARGPSAGGGGAYRSFFLCSPHERRAIMREVPVWLPLYPSTKKTSMPGNSPRTTGWFDRDQIYFAASAVPHGYASFE
jgi:hypothetical protein